MVDARCTRARNVALKGVLNVMLMVEQTSTNSENQACMTLDQLKRLILADRRTPEKNGVIRRPCDRADPDRPVCAGCSGCAVELLLCHGHGPIRKGLLVRPLHISGRPRPILREFSAEGQGKPFLLRSSFSKTRGLILHRCALLSIEASTIAESMNGRCKICYCARTVHSSPRRR